MLLENQVAIVTGASRGIGKATAKKFASEGAAVMLIARNIDTLDKVKAEIEAAGGKAYSYQCDMGVDKEIEDTVQAITDRFGRIDILINNAGITKEAPLVDMPIKDWDEVIRINLRSVMVMTKACLPIMVKQHFGNIVFIASGTALRGMPGNSPYSAAKAAGLCFMQALGDEMRPDGIRCNTICPGPVDTEMFKNSNRRDFILSAGGDVVQPETLANTCLFLASSLSEGMSSQVVSLRGFIRW
ncbi:MAG: SDR family oxidoreductase [Clostridia bacterium]|nr:SDR family oxidoreductase [Clostridia bacterium]